MPIDLADPASPLFCPRATLLGAITYLVRLPGGPWNVADSAALKILIHVYRRTLPVGQSEDEYVKTWLATLYRLACSVSPDLPAHLAAS